jgi:hypothetical protein
MKVRFTAASLAALLLGGALVAADLKSGLKPGERVSPFNPLHITGPGEGGKACLV